MRMNMDDEQASAYAPSSPIGIHDPIVVDALFDDDHPHHAAANSFPSSSSSSSFSLPSASLSCSPESSAHVLAAPATAAASSQYLEVSSQVPPLPSAVPPYDHHYTNLHVSSLAPEHLDAAAAMAPATSNTGAFKRYAQHLGPKKAPKPGACGQRMFKTAMSVLSKMHAAERYKYSQQQYYYQQQAAAPPSVNQLQHMFSERKRREKLNDSFHALKAVLPPGAKKDKTSILIRAREYVKSLEAKVLELEEKNRSLESRPRCHKDAGGDRDSGEKRVQVEITRSAAKGERHLCTVKIVVRSPCNTMDVVLRTLQCLRDQIGDGVSMVAMSTTSGSDGPSSGVKNTSTPLADELTLQIKSPPGARWEEQPVKDAVAKVVADVLTPPSAAAATQQQQ